MSTTVEEIRRVWGRPIAAATKGIPSLCGICLSWYGICLSWWWIGFSWWGIRFSWRRIGLSWWRFGAGNSSGRGQAELEIWRRLQLEQLVEEVEEWVWRQLEQVVVEEE